MAFSLHRQAFWFSGVLVALSLEQALTSVAPHLLPSTGSGTWPVVPDAVRLLVFLLVSVRLLLGAAVHFEELVDEEGALSSAYRLDFVSGFVHFLLLFVWSLTLDATTVPPSAYLVLLAAVLGYDLVWVLFTFRFARKQVWLWTFVNVATLITGGLFYVVALQVGLGHPVAEFVALAVVAIVSVVDLAEMTRGRPIFGALLARMIPDGALRTPHNGSESD